MDNPGNPINPRERLIHIVGLLLKVENHLKVINQGLLHEDSAIHFCDVVDSASQILYSANAELDAIVLHVLFLEHQGILPLPEEKLIFFERKRNQRDRELPSEDRELPSESEPKPELEE